jgi:hypothetical protein
MFYHDIALLIGFGLVRTEHERPTMPVAHSINHVAPGVTITGGEMQPGASKWLVAVANNFPSCRGVDEGRTTGENESVTL